MRKDKINSNVAKIVAIVLSILTIVDLLIIWISINNNHNLKTNLKVYQNGEEVDALKMNNITLLPNEVSSFEAEVFTRVDGIYMMYLTFEGDKSNLSNNTYVDITSKDNSKEHLNLSSLIDGGEQEYFTLNLRNDAKEKVTFSYYLGDEIDGNINGLSMDVTITLTIKNYELKL